jgi:acyl-CoA oxidase
MHTAARRLGVLQCHLTSDKAIQFEGCEDILEAAGLSSSFPKEINEKRSQIAGLLEQQSGLILQAYAQDSFPTEFKRVLRSLDILGLEEPAYGIRRLRLIERMATIYELSRSDAGFCTYYLMMQGLTITTLVLLGSETQKAKYLPPLCRADLISAWALTEPEAGSDAGALELSALPVEGGFCLNGVKKWAGNASISDICIVFAVNRQTGKVLSLIVETASAGLSMEDIKHRLAFRTMKHSLMEFNNVFVPADNLLLRAKDFISGPNAVLTLSRLGIGWMCAGLIAGAYAHVIRQLNARLVKSGSLSVISAKLNRILGIFKGYFLLSLQQTNLYSQGKVSPGNVSLVKCESTRAAREVLRITSELLEENGLELDSFAIKALADIEVAYTYEGTYDVNLLVAGRDLTGLASIKAPSELSKPA